MPTAPPRFAKESSTAAAGPLGFAVSALQSVRQISFMARRYPVASLVFLGAAAVWVCWQMASESRVPQENRR